MCVFKRCLRVSQPVPIKLRQGCSEMRMVKCPCFYFPIYSTYNLSEYLNMLQDTSSTETGAVQFDTD